MYKRSRVTGYVEPLDADALPMYERSVAVTGYVEPIDEIPKLQKIGLEMGIDLEKLGLDMEELKKLESLRPLHCKERAKLAKDCVKSLGLLLLELHKEKEKNNATI